MTKQKCLSYSIQLLYKEHTTTVQRSITSENDHKIW